MLFKFKCFQQTVIEVLKLSVYKDTKIAIQIKH